MTDTVTIYCKNTKQYYDIQRGTSLMALKDQIGINLISYHHGARQLQVAEPQFPDLQAQGY